MTEKSIYKVDLQKIKQAIDHDPSKIEDIRQLFPDAVTDTRILCKIGDVLMRDQYKVDFNNERTLLDEAEEGFQSNLYIVVHDANRNELRLLNLHTGKLWQGIVPYEKSMKLVGISYSTFDKLVAGVSKTESFKLLWKNKYNDR